MFVLEYYCQIKEPSSFRYNVIGGVKECLIIQREQEKLDLIRQAKKDLFKEIKDEIKELKDLTSKLDAILLDDDLKKEVKKELEEEVEIEKNIFIKKKTPSPSKSFSTNKKHVRPRKRKSFEKPAEPRTEKSFEYTLDQIEQKLAELKKD